ncbi:permease [Bifidobacterium lemurum]|uniref:Permease n=1 Tax=Bifidobacterium lemurum TaxID=1603886 RepID=A0A261FQ17_9BIFI|nr:MFS transporter [Bifidobacterium lemurum]OZG61281.1 permease [Bifidobacterium lemurum]QOL34673.1 MFS transporter [Bifidobacterium lemurum]
MSSQHKTNWRPWLVFAGCCVLSLVGFGLIVNTAGLYYTPLCEELGISRAQIALASSIMAIATMPTMLLAGGIMKRVDSRVLISVCITVVALLFLLQSFFTQLWQFYVSFALMGVAYVIPISLAPSVLLTNWFEDKLGLAMGIALGISGIGGMIFNPIVSAWITNLGWRSSYRITALVLAVCILPFAIFAFKFRPDASRNEYAYGHVASADEKQGVQTELTGMSAKQAFKTKSFALLVVVSVLLQVVAAMVQHVSGHEVAQGLTLEQGSLVVSGIMLGAAVGKATIGMLLDRMKTELVILIYAAVGLIGWGLMALSGAVTPATIAGFLAGLGQGVVLVALPWMIRQFFGQKDYATILSVVSVFGSVASAIAGTAHGAVYDLTGSYLPSLVGNVAFYVIAAAAAIMAYKLRPVKDARASR